MKIYTYRSGHKTLKRFLSITLSLLVLVQMVPISVFAAPQGAGAIWTNIGPCGAPQNVNQYVVGQHLFIHGNNFDPNTTYNWTFKNPGANGTILESGTLTTDANGAVCLDAFTFGPQHVGGPYQVNVGDAKNDNLKVDAAAPTTGTLTLVKNVVKDNGGTAVATDWTLSANGATNISGTTGQPSVTNATVTGGGNYDLSESGGPTGYTLTGWSCTGATMIDGDTVQIAVGANVTCTATNNDVSPKITVTKVVTNNSQTGTSTVLDFPLSVGNTSVTSGVETSINAGNYTISESGPTAGYTATFSGDCAADGSITLSVGDVKNCTITNDDNPLPPPTQGTLKVTKVVVNDDLTGSSVVGDFTLYVDSSTVVSGAVNNLNPGSYVVSEGAHAGYNSTISGDCDANGNVSLLAGQVKECTITNNDIARDPGPDMGNLIVTKVVINDNNTANKVVADFPLFVGSTSVVSGNLNSLVVGSYVVSETYNSNEYTQSFSGDCDASGNVNVLVNATSSCTITNNDIAPTPNDEPVLGCMDVNANNYNSNATEDTNPTSCTYNSTTTTSGGGGSHRSGGGGIVLGINNDTPQGQVLGATFEPGLPATGNGPINTDSTNTLAVLFAGLMVLVGLNLASFKALKLEVK